MKITIAGGGNIGTQFAVHCAEKGHEVTIYTSAPDLFEKHLYIVDENGNITHEGDIRRAVHDPLIAFGEADLIIVTFPATMMKAISDLIYEYSDKKTIIGVVPGNGGSECAFRKCIERGNVFFGIERVPAIARLITKGKIVRSIGYRNELHISSLPIKNAEQCAILIESIFNIPCIVIPNYLNLTLTPSNPILHTTRLRTIFRDYHHGIVYDHLPLFYEEWDDESSELLLACDDEVQKICKALPEFHLEYVKSLRVHYESETISAITKKISSIPSFRGLTTPSKLTDANKFIPDLHSRYFTADFLFGLTIIQQIGEFAGEKTPNINDTMNWYRNIAEESIEFSFTDYGIYDKKTLAAFYL